MSSFQKRATREPLEDRWRDGARKWRGGNEGRSNLEEIAIIRLPTTETWGASPPNNARLKMKKKRKKEKKGRGKIKNIKATNRRNCSSTIVPRPQHTSESRGFREGSILASSVPAYRNCIVSFGIGRGEGVSKRDNCARIVKDPFFFSIGED